MREEVAEKAGQGEWLPWVGSQTGGMGCGRVVRVERGGNGWVKLVGIKSDWWLGQDGLRWVGLGRNRWRVLDWARLE